MLNEDFTLVVENQMNICRDMLVKKAAEYATSDRLHNFRQSAHMTRSTNKQALAGMMIKHISSIYDMIRDDGSYSLDVWSEKITDHLNYLILLKALVVEELMHVDPTLPI